MKSIKKVFNLGLAVFLSSGIFLPSLSLADSIMINKENTSGVNIRAEKSNYAQIYGIVEDYIPLEVKGEDDTWFEISYEGKKAYLGKSYFFRLKDSLLLKNSYLKEKPDKTSKNKLDYMLLKNTSLTILDFDKDSDYIKVSYNNQAYNNDKVNKNKDKEKLQEIGYVKLEDLDISKEDKKKLDQIKKDYKDMNEAIERQKEEEKRQAEEEVYEEIYYVYYLVDENGQIIADSSTDIGASIYNTSLDYVGSPYVFGGTSKENGIDCSGLVLRVFENYGVSLPHSSKMQATYGQRVNFGEEKAGDLVFFGSSYDDIYHVAIADGMGNMVHAANPGQGVIVSPIYDPFVIKRIIE